MVSLGHDRGMAHRLLFQDSTRPACRHRMEGLLSPERSVNLIISVVVAIILIVLLLMLLGVVASPF